MKAEHIRRVRATIRETQTQFARRVGVSGPAVVSRWEAGLQVPLPTHRRIIEQLARDFSVEL